MADIRINARLDEQAANDLSFLRHELGETSITHVIKLSIRKLAEEVRDSTKAKHQKRIWLDSGYIGSFEGSEDLSTNYKQYLTDILDEKYPTE